MRATMVIATASRQKPSGNTQRVLDLRNRIRAGSTTSPGTTAIPKTRLIPLEKRNPMLGAFTTCRAMFANSFPIGMETTITATALPRIRRVPRPLRAVREVFPADHAVVREESGAGMVLMVRLRSLMDRRRFLADRAAAAVDLVD